MGDPRSTARWQQLCRQVKAEESRCWICGGHRFVKVRRHPLSKSVDHVVPPSRGGAWFDRRNCRLAHLRCNSAKGDRLLPTVEVEPRSEVW